MVDSRIEVSNQRILDRIRYHQFGVLIEVANGITFPQKRQEKKKQVVNGRNIIQKAVGDSAEIFGGLAVIKYTEEPIKEIDVQISIPQYDEVILYKSAELVLESSYYLDQQYLNLLALALRSVDNGNIILGEYLNKSFQTKSTAKKNIHQRSYLDILGKVKGAVLEYYVRELFEQALSAQHTFALGTTFRDLEVRPQRLYHTDLIIAAARTDFSSALENITRQYSGRNKISVEFPSGKLIK